MFFNPAELHDLAPPDHLRELPEASVAELVAIVISEMPHMPHTLAVELKAFAETRAVHDGYRVAASLRYVHRREGLAQEIDDALDAD
jgi:hypothetical protein